jgi:hypothetical protein
VEVRGGRKQWKEGEENGIEGQNGVKGGRNN